MKPRPPEEMLRRQLDKLEAAIVEVEAEHAEALPGGEEPPVAEAPAPHEEIAHDHHGAEEVHTEPHEKEPAPAPAEAHVHEEPAAAAPVEEGPGYDAPAAHVEESHAPEHQPAEEWSEPHGADEPFAPVAEHAGVEHHADVHEEPALEPVYHEEPQRHWEEPQQHTEPHHVEEAPAVAAAAAPHVPPRPADDVISQVEQIWAEVDAPASHAAPGPAAARHNEPVMPAAAFTEAPFGQPVEGPVNSKAPAINTGFAWDADVFEELQPIPAPSKPAQQPARQMPENAFDDVDLFADVHPSRKTASEADATNDGWRELKELAGFDKRAEDERRGGSAVPPDLDQAMAAKLQGRSFRMEPKRRRINVTGIIVTLVCLAVVGGGGYAAWLNRDALNNMVTKLVSSAPKKAATPATSDTASSNTPNNGNAAAPAQPTAAPQQANTAAQQPAGAGKTDTAALGSDPNTVNTKFTQRLLANGTEEDEGPAPNGQPGLVEGKSVAEQNVASAATPPAANNAGTVQSQAPATAAPGTPSASTDQQPPAVGQQQQAVANQPPPVTQQTAPSTDGQKVFLYEERLGQTSPTAFQGTVSWSLQEGKGPDGRPEPSVQGLITVPDRGLTATITVSRNSDSSLPASHLIELAFQVPPNFEGGAIDNVQRVALKATEQDRGDALIAVPAKVTDDVYMVALNDFPDARKTNLDLLKSRNWIDIPIVYRNGRRALLTMEKGPTGTDAFNKAIAEWQALGGVASSGQ
jgi:hypothetical protein